jgi:hypothetical protein
MAGIQLALLEKSALAIRRAGIETACHRLFNAICVND